MRAAIIAAALGGGAYQSGPWCRCPCPVHGGRGAALALRDGERGLIAVCHAGCSSNDIFAELRRRELIGPGTPGNDLGADVAEVPRRREAEARDRHQRITLARDIVATSLPAESTPAARYLRTRILGISELPPVLRYIPMYDLYARHPSGSCRPVMVAAVEHVEDGVVGAHRTWLALDGSAKASLDPVRISTGPIKGGAVRLGEIRSDMPLVIAEGIESAMAASELTGWPAWAAMSAGGIKGLVLPPDARDILIAIDRDRNGTGERAARHAACRWVGERRRVRLLIPDRIGADPNDLLKEARRVA